MMSESSDSKNSFESSHEMSASVGGKAVSEERCSISAPSDMKPRPFVDSLMTQIKILLWKRLTEIKKQPMEIAKIFVPPIFMFLLIISMYAVFFGGSSGSDGSVEVFLLPFAFWIFAQKIVVYIMFEKHYRLYEAMKMMGLKETSYWISYYLFDAVFIGFLVSFLCMICSTYGLFNHGNLGGILGFLMCFFFSITPFSYFLTTFFDTPQSSGQITIGILLGFYVLYMALSVESASEGLQGMYCLFPPLAFQLGCASFQDSYSGIDTSNICGIMIADTFIYSILAWYMAQVWPSEYGVHKPFWFPLDPNYWFPEKKMEKMDGTAASPLAPEDPKRNVPTEEANETVLGAPSIIVDRLRKTFSSGQVAVNDLSFKMYADQIFVLLGHNGAGKTTTINMLTGLLSPDYFSEGDASIYGYSIHDEMEMVRRTMGVCPQHDVLFEQLTVKEHILLFSQLKGNSAEAAEAEVAGLAKQFHLETRLDHTGSELSGGQKRKLSVAIALCGGSKFIVLDEPTAGMDPLARRELWDLLASLRHGRTMLLTTHYMDEADVLGDRVAIMSLGEMQCMGSTHFLKITFGAGYRLICNHESGEALPSDTLNALTTFIKDRIPGSEYTKEESSDTNVREQSSYILPFNAQTHFGEFFMKFDEVKGEFGIDSYGVQITSMEDVFLKVGEDHSVTPQTTDRIGIGTNAAYDANFSSQVVGIAMRKLRIAKNDIVTIPLVGLPVVVAITSAALYANNTISNSTPTKDLTTVLMYVGAYLGIPGLLVEFIVREREDKLRTVLTIMGCDFKAYWLGTFIADFILMSVPIAAIYLSWLSAGMSDFTTNVGGLCWFIILTFTVQLISFSYVCSYIFSTPKSAIAFMPMFIVLLILTPMILLNVIYLVFSAGLHIWTPTTDFFAGVLLWGIMLTSPHGALFAALLDVSIDLSTYIPAFPPVAVCMCVMMGQAAGFLFLAYWTDSRSSAILERQVDENFNEACLQNLDDDVKAERDRTLGAGGQDAKTLAQSTDGSGLLVVDRLRKVFPPKRVNGSPVVATQDVAFAVKHGEIFGLLGANGAGKTTTLSMLTRHLVPTSGDAYITGKSILSEFANGAKHMGVVTQNNSLWDLLSVEDHLYLFARLRGVPEDLVADLVTGACDQLELAPHRKKLAGRLSGGMKRKLCVAIALIGDPEVVLLDEPSAGLDPVSRRNLWNVILRTMSHRAVILTTHSMEEAEALCARIAIMVKGQMRAIGTKQHLKVKFGSGYELCMKLLISKDADPTVRIGEASAFVTSVFPSAILIAENGGLVTFQIPKDEMKMGVAFTQLELKKEELGIEDYSIAQPTLEQVFIRTVVNNSDYEMQTRNSIAASSSVRGSSKLLLDDVNALSDAEGDYAFVEPTNPCGCVRDTVKYKLTVPCTLLFLILEGTYIGTGGHVSALVAFATITLIFACVGCNMLCCPCCQPVKGADE